MRNRRTRVMVLSAAAQLLCEEDGEPPAEGILTLMAAAVLIAARHGQLDESKWVVECMEAAIAVGQELGAIIEKDTLQ